jgi:hypothetical protein
MGHRITHPFESTRCSRFYPAGALRDTESLLTLAGDGEVILSLSFGISCIMRHMGLHRKRESGSQVGIAAHQPPKNRT